MTDKGGRFGTEFWRWYCGYGECSEDAYRVKVPASRSYELELHLEPELNAYQLYLSAQGSEERWTLGWMDEAGAHPFGLRDDESQAISVYANHQGFDTSLARLLLAPFTGFASGDIDKVKERRLHCAADLRKLGVHGDLQMLSERLFASPPGEDDYAWQYSGRLGWCFAGEYPCYSLRNLAHESGEEGRFPFAHLQALRKELGLFK